jgi:hypothetical protein
VNQYDGDFSLLEYLYTSEGSHSAILGTAYEQIFGLDLDSQVIII